MKTNLVNDSQKLVKDLVKENNDLISRSTLKEAIRKRLSISSLKYLTEQEKVIVDEIDNAPTVDTDLSEYSDKLWKEAYERGHKRGHKEGYEQAILDGKTNFSRPQGKWIFSGGNSYYCSLCKRSISTTLTRPTELFPFCHCGADMSEEA